MHVPVLHPEILETLVSSLKGERSPHAVLISGSRGIGALALAEDAASRILEINVSALDTHPDFSRLVPDPEKKSIGVDETRIACSRLYMTPAMGGRRVLLVAEAEILTDNAANAMLKTVEEPPAGAVVFILTTRLSAIPATIRSRCQHFRLPIPERNSSMSALKTLVPGTSETDASILLDLAAGSPGDAADIAAINGDGIYKSLVQTVRYLQKPDGRIPRSRIQAFAEAYGKAETWPITNRLVDTLLYRAALASCGHPAVSVSSEEQSLLAAFADGAGITAITQTQALVQRVIEDTNHQHLDVAYATQRLLMALEHGLRQQV